ncbi:MAG: aldo/keto reductase [Anaerolineae bacterium]|nr:aldo/keto reductase [Thermoflexales bacterium]MDW8407919.1 aldo/keto reductase [Anaerolineae bacterium]
MTPSSLKPDRILGRCGLRVTPIGLGGGWLGYKAGGHIDEETGIATVLRALELGINLIDTSPMYGSEASERIIGLALCEWFRRGYARDSLVISTKTGTRPGSVGDYSADATYRSVELSLKALGLDTIDILHVHDPRDLEPVLQPGGALSALIRLREQGVIRAIGLGVRNLAFHRRCIETGEFDVSLTYGDYNLLSQEAAVDLLPLAQARDVGILNGMAIMYGLLGGDDPRAVARRSNRHFQPALVERAHHLWQWALERGVNLLALNLQYCVRRPWVTSTLVGAACPEEVEDDVRAFTQPISSSIWTALGRDFPELM